MTKLAIAALTAFLTFGAARAQDAITPEKTALLKELVKVTDLAAVTQKTMGMMANQVGANINDNVLKTMPGFDKLPPEKRERAVLAARDMSQRVVKRMFEAMSKQVNFTELIDAVYIPVYNKYYSEEDLKGLIAFYKTPAGVKFVKVMPEVQAEAARLSQETLTPKIMKIVTDIMGEESKIMEEEMKKLQQ